MVDALIQQKSESSKHPECIFCKIIAGEIPCSKIFEDEDIIAFMDIAPINKGHTLVVPKKHHEFIWELPPEIVDKIFRAVQRLTLPLRDAVNADGINVGMNNGKAAGQLVPHCHVHVIPRFDNDGFKHWPNGSYSEGELDDIKEEIVKRI